MIEWNSVLTTVLAAVIVAALGWVWTKTMGSRIWNDLGPNRWLAVVSVAALFFGVAALILPASLLSRVTLHSQSACLDNPDTNYRICFESDGDLVIYDKSKPSPSTSNGTPVWGSGRPK
jgi:hypothetical protein